MVSIKEVAKHAGVAISTVSKVLNGYPNVSEETKKKVQDAIKELNYIPNSIAAALSSKQFGRIALVLDPNRQTQAIDQIFMQYLVGALDKAKELNVEVVTIFPSMIAGMTAEEITRSFLSQSISGVVIYGMSKEDKVLQKLIREKQFACVVVDAPIVNSRTNIFSRQALPETAEKQTGGSTRNKNAYPCRPCITQKNIKLWQTRAQKRKDCSTSGSLHPMTG